MNQSNFRGIDRATKAVCLILTGICPVVPALYVSTLFGQIANSSGSDDARGWALLFVMIIAIGIFPFVILMAIPPIVFLVVRSAAIKIVGTILLVIDTLVFAMELLLIHLVEKAGDALTTFMIVMWVFYLLMAALCVFRIWMLSNEEQ